MPERPTVVWRRLDRPGREAASVRRIWSGWRLFGTVELEHDGQKVCLSHGTTCDPHWRTRDCEVTGFIGDAPVAVHVRRDFSGRWTLDDAPVPEVAGCADVDLAFSPITNLLPIRRIALPIGGSASVRAAWLRFPELTLEVLDQTYTRVEHDCYRYESADGTFRSDLAVDENGLVLNYPGLWIAER